MIARMARLIVAGLVLAVTASGARAEKLDTSELLGFWLGNWADTTMGTGGLFSLSWDQPVPGGTVLVTWHFSGNFFGCGEEIGPVAGGLFHNGPNAFTPHAVRVNSDDDVFGHIRVKSKGTTFKVRGKNACQGAGPSKYRMSGKKVGTDFTGQVSAKVDGGTEHLTVTLHKVQ